MVRMSLPAATLLTALALLSGRNALAQAVSVTPAAAVAANAATFAAAVPAADKVYPPLPTLAMLPPVAEEEAPAVRSSSRRRKGRVAVVTPERKAPPAPVVRLIVSDASHAYLDSVQRQIDEALAK